MKSLRSLFRIGLGPSSSHTMGPFNAVTAYLEAHPEADRLHVSLYGSLAATGKGHLTDKAVKDAFKGEVTIEWHPKENLPVHPNGMKIASINSDGDLYDKWTYYSIGGGDIICMDMPVEGENGPEIYSMNTLKEIMDWCNRSGKSYWEYVRRKHLRLLGASPACLGSHAEGC